MAKLEMEQESGRGWGLLLLAGLCGVLLGAGLTQVFLRHVGHDQAWCVYAADLMLHGVPLDGDRLVEVNPPFILWFSTMPVFVGSLLHVGNLNGFRVFFDVLEVSSLGCTCYLLQRLFRPGRRDSWLFFLALIVATLWLISEDSLGQREHLLVLLFLPYLVLAAGRMSGQGLAVPAALMVGISGGLAICLKPQHAIAVIAVELLVLASRKSVRALWRPELLALSMTLVLYALSVELFGRAYLVNVAPWLFLTYSSLNVPLGAVLHSSTHVALGIMAGWAMVVLTWRQRTRFLALPTVLGVASVGSLAAYILQQKAWSYQEIPAGMFAVLFLAAVLIAWLDRRLPKGWPGMASTRSGATALCFLACTLLSGAFDLHFGHHKGYYELKKQELAAIYARYPEGSAVSYYSTEPWELPLVMEQHKVLGQRFNYYWMMPAIIKGQDPSGEPHRLNLAKIQELTAFQLGAMSADLDRWKPAVVVIDRCGPGLCPALHREHFNTVLDWFRTDATFQREWSRYRPVDRVDQLDVYQRVP